MTKCFIAIFFMITLTATAHAQLGRKWDARFGGKSDEICYKIFRTPDGGCVIGGISDSGNDGDKTSLQRGSGDYYIVRIDSVGNKLWDKSYGGSGAEIMFAMAVTPDGGILLAGHSASGADGDKTEPSRGGSDYWVVRLDPNGNKLWDKRYGGSGTELLGDARPCADGGFILTGTSRSNASWDKGEDNKSWENGWVVRIDSLGNLMWEETYQSAADMLLWAGMELSDGGFLFGGKAWPDSTYDISEYGNGIASADIWLARTDAQGVILWDKRYGGASDEGLNYILGTSDGGFLIVGDRGGEWLVRIDSVGNALWQVPYGSGGQFTGVSATSDGGFLLSEYTAIDAPNGDKTEANFGRTQTWVLKVDSAGSKVWDKTIFTAETNGGYAIESKPGCIVVGTDCRGGIGGYKTQPNWDTTLTTADFWLVELCDGYIDTTLCPQQPCTGITETATLQAKLYPNPTMGTLTIELPNAQGGSMALYNLLGQSVYQTTLAGGQNTVDVNLPPGLYLYRITSGGKAVNGKLLVE